MNDEGPDSDIVLSSRIRLARNIDQFNFPFLISNEEALKVIETLKSRVRKAHSSNTGNMDLLNDG